MRFAFISYIQKMEATREEKLKALFEWRSLENFTTIRHKNIQINSKRTRRKVPTLPNLRVKVAPYNFIVANPIEMQTARKNKISVTEDITQKYWTNISLSNEIYCKSRTKKFSQKFFSFFRLYWRLIRECSKSSLRICRINTKCTAISLHLFVYFMMCHFVEFLQPRKKVGNHFWFETQSFRI